MDGNPDESDEDEDEDEDEENNDDDKDNNNSQDKNNVDNGDNVSTLETAPVRTEDDLQNDFELVDDSRIGFTICFNKRLYNGLL